jgi:hypothetical protein
MNTGEPAAPQPPSEPPAAQPPSEPPAAQPPSELDALAAVRARNLLIASVRTRLRGAGLDVRELASELVISHPGHPERGRIYVKYANGEVSHRRTVWSYLGHIDGYGPPDPDADPPVDIHAIIAALGGRAP